MAHSRWTLDIGGISLDLVGHPEWVGRLAEAWSGWAGEPPGWEVRLEQDPTLPRPKESLFNARPQFDAGRCTLSIPGFAGEVVPQGEQALLRAHPAAGMWDVSCFVRTAFALRAFDCGRLLFHSAGVVHRGAAYALFGHSGSGKTTAARLSADKPVLNDDLLLLRPAAKGWEACATPFGRRRTPEVRSAPLRALLRLAQAEEDRVEPLPPGRALGELVANSPVVNADPLRAAALLARWEDILPTAPAFLLRFLRSDSFWEVVDAHFG